MRWRVAATWAKAIAARVVRVRRRRREGGLAAQRGLCLVGLGCVMTVLCGCRTAGYYRQAIGGQLEILSARRPIAKLLEDSETPLSLKRRLKEVLALRGFARDALKLPADRHYLTYVALSRPHAVWNVYACPRFSLEPKSWWYPLVGSLNYRGYFSRADAERYAARLRRRGYDVHVEGVDAYSTLGWFRDPVLSTFIDYRDTDLAATLFHELAHQKLFVSGDTDFNEAFATLVERRGVMAWLRSEGREEDLERYRVRVRRQTEFMGLIRDYRERLEALYARKGELDAERMAEEKEAIFKALRKAYARAKVDWGGYSGYDDWFTEPINNARLSSIATYHQWVPAFAALFEAKGGEWAAFHREVERWARMGEERREAELTKWRVRYPTCESGNSR